MHECLAGWEAVDTHTIVNELLQSFLSMQFLVSHSLGPRMHFPPCSPAGPCLQIAELCSFLNVSPSHEIRTDPTCFEPCHCYAASISLQLKGGYCRFLHSSLDGQTQDPTKPLSSSFAHLESQICWCISIYMLAYRNICLQFLVPTRQLRSHKVL